MRGRMNDVKSYVPPFAIGAALEGGAVGEVVASQGDSVEPGQHVLARKEVSAELWDELRRACDGVLGRPSMRHLRPAV